MKYSSNCREISENEEAQYQICRNASQKALSRYNGLILKLYNPVAVHQTKAVRFEIISTLIYGTES